MEKLLKLIDKRIEKLNKQLEAQEGEGEFTQGALSELYRIRNIVAINCL